MMKNELFNLLCDLDKELSDILNQLMDKDIEISPYNLELLKQEVEVIKDKIKNKITDENTDENCFSSLEKAKAKKYLILLTLAICITLFAPELFPIIILFPFAFNNNSKTNEDIDEVELKRFVTLISNEIQNCNTFINSRKNEIRSNSKKPKFVSEFDYANCVINYFLENPTTPTYPLNELDDKIKLYIIKILQDDLKVDIKNIESLMICARSQILKNNVVSQSESFLRERKKC